SSLSASGVSASAVESAIPAESLTAPPGPRPDVRQVQEAVAAKLGLTVDALVSPRRTADLARGRQLAMYLTRELTDLSLPEIAQAFNRRDHTTVLHAVRRVETRALEDANLSRTVEELTAQLTPTQPDATQVGSTQD